MDQIIMELDSFLKIQKIWWQSMEDKDRLDRLKQQQRKL